MAVIEPVASAAGENEADKDFLEFADTHFDADWYRENNPDVAAAGLGPRDHWLHHGVWEARAPGPGIKVWCAGPPPAANENWRAFRFQGRELWLRARDREEEQFLAWLDEHFDAPWYLRLYPDIAAAGVDPLQHWLASGHAEGRQIAPGFCLWQVHGGANGVDRLAYRGKVFRVQFPLDGDIARQLLAQARHDPDVIAPGPGTLDRLRRAAAGDLGERYGLDTARLLSQIPSRPSFVFLVNVLGIGGAEKYTADMIGALLAQGQRDILVIVTLQSRADAEKLHAMEILGAYWNAELLFWQDCFDTPADTQNGMLLARLLNALRPTHIVCINSDTGFEAVAQYAPALARIAKLFCAYFVLGDTPRVVMESRFPRRTSPHAASFTDNSHTAEILRERYQALGGPEVVVLPNRIKPVEDALFEQRVQARRQRAAMPARQRKWVWISRITAYQKRADLVSALAMLLPGDAFDIFGPLEEPLETLGLIKPNIRHLGVLESVIGADLRAYDGYLLGSRFEGLPNVVLEMAQHGLPLILTRVGGLTDTFDDECVDFIEYDGDNAALAGRFAQVMDKVAKLDADQVESRARRARARVAARHGEAVFAAGVARLFGLA